MEAGEELCISYGAPGQLTFVDAEAERVRAEEEEEARREGEGGFSGSGRVKWEGEGRGVVVVVGILDFVGVVVGGVGVSIVVCCGFEL